MSPKVRTALALSRSDWGVFIKAWFLLLYFDFLLRIRSYRRIKEYLQNDAPGSSEVSSEQAWETIRRDQRLMLLAARNHVYPMGCLRQALTLKELLVTQGITTKIRIGVRKKEGQLLAHAWLEFESQSIEVSPDGEERFEPLSSLEDLP